MTYAIVSDIHANEEALRRALVDAREQGAGAVICLGDIVGYGPLPAEALALVRSTASVVLAGNHDDAVSGRLDPESFVDLASDAVTRHREALSKADVEWLRTLPHTYAGEGFLAAHGDFTAPEAFAYVDNAEAASANFAATQAPLMFVGHTHVPAIDLTGASGAVYRLAPQDFVLEPGKRYIVNPGSVGYPREENGECRSSYVLYDTETGTVRFRFLPFAVSSVLQRGRSARVWGLSTRRLRMVLVALGAVALAAVGLAVWRMTRPPERIAVKVEVDAERQLVFAERDLPLDGASVRVSPNLRLAKGSDPVRLRIRFLDAAGERVSETERFVKGSSSAGESVPKTAARVIFTILKNRVEEHPAVTAFAPGVCDETKKTGKRP